MPTPAGPLPPLREVIARHGLDARRALGQHFLLDANITDRIVRACGPLAGRSVLEVGPGPGGLTRSLLASDAAHIVAIELDPRAIAALRELAQTAPGRLTLIQADALAVDAPPLLAPPRIIAANLPYNVATPLLVGWLRQAAAFERMALMFQAEVADRICAAPATPAYGRLSVLAQWLCRVDLRLRLPPSVFVPPPQVHSAVVVLEPHPQQPAPALFAAMERVTAAAFGQRRKMLRGALKALDAPALLARSGIDGQRRAETLTIAEFERLAAATLEPPRTPAPPRRSAPAVHSEAPMNDMPGQATSPRTDVVAAIFEDYPAACAARDALAAAGIPLPATEIIHRTGAAADPAATWQAVGAAAYVPHDHAHGYAEAIDRGHALLFVRAAADRQPEVMRLLEAQSPIDMTRRAQQWTQSGWTGIHRSQAATPPPTLNFETQSFPDHVEMTGMVNENAPSRGVGAPLVNPMGIAVPGLRSTGTSRVRRFEQSDLFPTTDG